MWPSLAWAAWLFNAANIALIASLTVGVVATFLIVWMGNVKEQYADLEAKALKERTTGLTVQSEQLKNDNLRLSIRLAELTTPRVIDADAVIKAAQPFSGTTFDISVFAPDPEVERLATSISEALTKAGWIALGWKAGSITFGMPGKPVWGVNNGVGAGILFDSKQAEPAAIAMFPALKLTIRDLTVAPSQKVQIVIVNPGALHFVIGQKPVTADPAVTH